MALAIEEMRSDPTTERELQGLKLMVDRWWVNPYKHDDYLVLNATEVSILHELMFAAGLDDPTKGTT